ncbi:hypothetical protein [Muricoccus radiodurans]|uniref:hypothetical protein n=1 Tax=Muricoccus radiodurans TaxID=2231721 RepID=UPI003CE70F65
MHSIIVQNSNTQPRATAHPLPRYAPSGRQAPRPAKPASPAPEGILSQSEIRALVREWLG